MDSRISRIRRSEEKSHTEVYTKEKLYDSNTWLRKPIKTIEDYKIQANSYDLIMAISALEHIDTEEHFFDKLREIGLGIRKYGMICLVINTEVNEFNINNGAEIEPNFEVNLPTEVLMQNLGNIFKNWEILKKNVVQQNYEIPRENIRSSLSTNVVTFVARKNN